MSRRAFLVSSCGAAATLLAMNAAYGAVRRRGGYYELPADAALDVPVARSALDKSEFVLAVQGHFVNPTGAWTKRLAAGAQPRLPFGPESYAHSTCVDIGRVAKRFRDVNFLVYHSGFVPGQPERAYDPTRSEGIDALVTSLEENGIRPGSNVYAELGSTWRFLMRDPDSAAHAIGKLVAHVGEDNVLWGTDSIWYGSPQDQIQAFRTFQIAMISSRLTAIRR